MKALLKAGNKIGIIGKSAFFTDLKDGVIALLIGQSQREPAL